MWTSLIEINEYSQYSKKFVFRSKRGAVCPIQTLNCQFFADLAWGSVEAAAAYRKLWRFSSKGFAIKWLDYRQPIMPTHTSGVTI